jgi:PKD repeat protein
MMSPAAVRSATPRVILVHGLVDLLVVVGALVLAGTSDAAEAHGRSPALALSAEALSPKDAEAPPASAARRSFSLSPTNAEPAAVCPVPKRGRYECESILVPTVKAKTEAEDQYRLGLGPAPAASPRYEGNGVEGGFSPSDLRSAYKLSSEGGEGQTVAIVDAYDDPHAQSDLAVYREDYDLPSCTTESGCFEKVNQQGEAKNYPAPNSEWALEISLDLDMVSAICPHCHILLVEADNNEIQDLGLAVEDAAKLGASVISDSWDGEESPKETSLNRYFDHPGVPVLFGSGDEGYGVLYPAASPDVIAVGGTSLTKADNARGWAETAWSGAGSGCSSYEPKPAWQKDEGCSKRTVADVSAVANPETPVSLYDSYERGGWLLVGGTSVATPVMAGVEALSSGAFRAAGPSAIYDAGRGGDLFDVTEGENGSCGSYLCQAEVGYDGPTGWGTPDGPLSLPVAITEAATVISTSKVTLHGSVDPGGLKTEYRFEYGETTSYGTRVPIPDESVGSGTEYADVSQAIEGLKGRTPYHYRTTATNAEGTFHGVDRTFGTTTPMPTTGAASEVHSSGATLHATVNPEGLATTYYFEYGTSSSYEHRTPSKGEEIGSGTVGVQVSAAIHGLTGNGTYHFRVVAKNAAGTVYGEDETFTTEPPEWDVQTLSQPGESSEEREAYGVSCVQSEACVAVGSHWSLSVHTDVTLAEIWDGETWSVMATPNPPGLEEGWKDGRYALLRGISCLTTSDCVAVGYYRNTGEEEYLESTGEKVEPLAEHWNGSTWTMMSVAAPSGADAGWLEGVSCTSSTECTAVGSFNDSSGVEDTLAERWNGSEWTTQTTPTTSGSGLKSVSCTSLTECTAVGSFTNGSGVEDTLAERWNGSKWTIQPTRNPTGTEASNYLSGVSCTSPTVCMAVGTHVSAHLSSFLEATLAERWDGSEWSVMPTPEPSPSKGSNLFGVSCISTSACTAVGDNYNPTASEQGAQPLGERWNGTTWSLLEVPALPEPPEWWHESWLYAVSCADSGACTALGNSLSAPKGELSHQIAFAEQELTPPFASFSVTPSPTPGHPVTFNGSSSSDPGGTIVNYEWSFGDGESASGATPSHTYAKPGRYTVTLKVTDAEGKTGKVSHTITVAEAPPTAAFSVTTLSPTAGQPVAFDGSASNDPEGPIASYGWSFGDGESASGATPSHTYDHAGDYTVTLTVTDAEGKTGKVSHLVRIAEVAPLASFSVTSSSPTAGQPLAFDGSASSDPGGTIVSYEWNFGDGSQGTGATPSHIYANPGSYTVTLTVTDNEGKIAEVSHLVDVAEAPPLASFSVTTPSPTAGQSVAFDGSASSGPDGPVTAYEWSFGDGESGSGVTTSHTYARRGSYTVTLKVTDAGGKTGEVSYTVHVAEAPPTAAFSVSTPSPTAAQPVSFDGSSSSDPGGTIVSYEWSFGDGENTDGAFPSHTYAEPGSYTVSLEVIDAEGKAGEVSHLVYIAQPISLSNLSAPLSNLITLPSKEATEPATKPTPKPLTRAQKLAKALRACQKDKKKTKRASCEKAARKNYAPQPKKSIRR